MYRIRRTEEMIADRYPEQQMRCPTHLCIGQEAIAVGVCAHLEPADYVFSTHRSHGHYLAKGGSLPALLGELYGRQSGCSLGKGGSMHLIDRAAGFLGAAPILGATIAVAVGAAFGTQMQNEPRVTVAFFGDAAIEEGIFYESASFAVLKQLPVVLICENNELSTCSPLAVRQPAGRSIASVAQGIGLRAAEGDGNDVREVYRLAEQAAHHARSGRGPSFLELHTYRWREHCGPAHDFYLGYRSEAEFLQRQKQCPLLQLRRHMIEQGAWSDRAMEQLTHEVNLEIDDAMRSAVTSPYPDAQLLLEHEYAS
jgi:pyruvate dehydrogenase E1 component alpha subunit